MAAALGAERREIVFTSGGTESDNLGVLGRWRALARAARAAGSSLPPIACSAVEHKAVLGAVHAAGAEGAEQLILAVDVDGRLDTGALDEAIAARPAVVSVMWANNEIGTMEPVDAVAARCRAAGIAFHSDAVQAFGKARVRVDEIPVDLLSISAHKIGGPKGIGALYVRGGTQAATLEPLVHGGTQEGTVRPGTESVPLAVAMGVAAELAAREQGEEARRLAALRDRLEGALLERIDGLVVNGVGAPRLPQTTSISIPGVERDALLMALDMEGVAVSTGAACQSGVVEPSHVLVAMGRALPGETTVRLSLGHSTTAAQIERAAEIIPAVVRRLWSLEKV